jgi:hypothetical protein
MNPDYQYRQLVETVLELNHDRFKTYFTQFLVLHFGIFIAIYQLGESTDLILNSSKNGLQLLLCLIGISLAFVWYKVLLHIKRDIREAWTKIWRYEQSLGLRLRISESPDGLRRRGAASMMLCVPLACGLAYLFPLLIYLRVCFGSS